MDEEQWLTSTDPDPMLELVQGLVSQRASRLFACACCRSIWAYLTDERSRRAVEVAEQFADGIVDQERLAAAEADAEAAIRVGEPLDYAKRAASCTCAGSEEESGQIADLAAKWVERTVKEKGAPFAGDIERVFQCELLRCIFGNPYRPLILAPSLLSESVTKLASAIYNERAWDRMGVLADALEECGVAAEAVAHCRLDTLHARGCFVVDAILGKE